MVFKGIKELSNMKILTAVEAFQIADIQKPIKEAEQLQQDFETVMAKIIYWANNGHDNILIDSIKPKTANRLRELGYSVIANISPIENRLIFHIGWGKDEPAKQPKRYEGNNPLLCILQNQLDTFNISLMQ
jgi:hypothetical protein